MITTRKHNQIIEHKDKTINDSGHNKLIEDLESVLNVARKGEFHDFFNKKYSAPKTELVNTLQDIINKTQDGEYDN